MSTTTEMVGTFREKLAGCKLVDLMPSQGQQPGFVLVFENANEQRLALTVAAGVQVNATLNNVGIQALFHVKLGEPTN